MWLYTCCVRCIIASVAILVLKNQHLSATFATMDIPAFCSASTNSPRSFIFNIQCPKEQQDNVVQDLKDWAMKQYINSRIINSIIINHDDLLYHIVTCSAPGRTDNKQRDLEKTTVHCCEEWENQPWQGIHRGVP